ncbi:MAG: xanthine dehydrogenase family protein subunit [Phenylobacterium sp.]|uniref:FAD binding domain-containing protein n=1 Tax=Phenylobacterium sp. TaxID=1871053 RepID=UPI002638689E|nr:xanthine dehydrogenase family protein subunit M [Phenylobacterium sp.]MDB5498811.1 xanthine dehydrogenase family protein subunit [Phenylobacterium sp.]
MRPFAYQRASSLAEASRLGAETGRGQCDAPAQFLAGGTTLVDLMKLDVLRPARLVDINRLRERHGGIEVAPQGLRLGALASMSDVAGDRAVQASYPVIAQSLQLAASAQLRNMATLGGNVLQKTRCPYYRDPSWTECNKRNPGSGCAALEGFNRNHAVLGVDRSCIAQYPGDLGVALVALDSQVIVNEGQSQRPIAFADLHRPVDGRPDLETMLNPGDVITAFIVPAGPWTRRSLYLKVRDRESYEFAIASAAVALDLDGDVVRGARIGLGGLAYRPWRAREAEDALVGKPLTEETARDAAHAALAGAVTHGDNDYKPELGRRTLVRALLQAKAMEV